MSTSEAQLTLVLNARNLATGVIDKFSASMAGVSNAARTMNAKVTDAFRSVKNGVVNGLGNLTETLAQGGGLDQALFAFGAYMAGQAAEALLENLLERMGESTLVGALGATLSAAGSALGSLLSSAIAIGAAAFPVVLAALIVGAIVFLINNPEIAGKIAEFAGGVVDFVIKGIAALPGLLLTAISGAVGFVADNLGPFVQRIVDFFLGIPGKLAALGGNIVSTIIAGFASLPGKVADVIRQAFAGLDITIGPFHVTGHGITIDFGHTNLTNVPGATPGSNPKGPTGYASGGWVGLFGPEWSRFGEQGPEYVLNARQSQSMMAPTGGLPIVVEGVTERELVEMMDRGLYFKLRRAAPQSGRV